RYRLINYTDTLQIFTLSLHDALPIFDEQNFYTGIKNDLDFGWIREKFTTKGNFSYLDTQQDFQNTRFVRGGIISEILRPNGSWADRKSTRLNSSHEKISYAVFCFKYK